MFSSLNRWWSSENPKPIEVEEAVAASPSSEFLPVDKNSDDIDIFLLPPAQLIELKRKTHHLAKRTYYFSKNNRGEFEIHCVDKGKAKWPRKLELTNELLAELNTISSRLQEKVSAPSSIDILLSPTQINELRELILKHDGVIFKIVTGSVFKKLLLAKFSKDAYFLVRGAKEVYELYYYNAHTNVKAPIMAYNGEHKVFYTLAELIEDAVDPSIYNDISISAEGLEIFGDTLSRIATPKHKFSTEDKKELLGLLNYYHEPLPDSDIFLKAKKHVTKVKQHVELMLKKVMDNNSYQKYLVTATKDSQGRYILPKEQAGNAKVINYMRFVNMLINMQKFFDITSGLHLQIIQTHHAYSLVKTGSTLYNSFSGWLEAYNVLYGDLEPLGAMTFLKNITSVAGLQRELQKFIPFDVQAASDQLTTNPFFLSYLNLGQSWVDMLKGTDDKIIALQKIITDLSKNLPAGGSASENMQQTLMEINKILLEVDSLQKSPKSLFDVLRMVYEVYPKITGLISSLPQSLESLKAVMKDNVLMTVQQMNLIFRDVILHLDQFEIEYHLQQGVVASYVFQDGISLNGMLTQFNNLIESFGFEFKPEERFPYSIAIHKQRNELLSLPSMPKSLLIVRMQQSKNDVQDQHAVTATQAATTKFLTERAVRVDGILKDRVRNLKAERGRWFAFARVREKKINLLEKLRIAFDKQQSLSDALQYMYRTYPADKDKMKLLWDGRTGELMRDINIASNASPTGMVEKVDYEIERLKQSRDNRKLIFEGARKKRLEGRILALEKLRHLLVQQGYDINEALKELSGSHPQDHQILLTREVLLVEELQFDNGFIAPEVFGKKIIDYVKPAETKLQFTPRDVHLKYGYVTAEINRRIRQLTRELKYSFFSADTKKQKILLLNELKNQLNYNSFPAALENLASNIQFRSTFYLLREGRTGVMMANLDLSAVSPTKKIIFIDHAITHLKRMRSQEYSLFNEQEHFIEDRIYALMQLKSKIEKHPDLSMTQILLKLYPDQNKFLLKYQQDLLEKLRQWDVVKQLKQEYRAANPPAPEVVELQVISNNPASAEEKIVAAEQPSSTATSPTWFYDSTIANIESLQDNSHQLFVAMLDQDTYKRYFANATRDDINRYVIDSDSSEPRRIHDYKQFFNMLVDAKIVFEKLKDMHAPIIDYYNNKTLTTFIGQLGGLLKNSINDLTQSYYNLYTDIDQLELVDYMAALTNPDSLKAQAVHFLPQETSGHTYNLMNNSFFYMMKKSERIFISTSELDERLDSAQKILATIEAELPPSDIAQKSTKKTIDNILFILTEARKFTNSPCKLWDVLKFVYNIYTPLKSLSKNYQQTYESLSAISQDRLLVVIQDLNLVMRDVMLAIDRFKLTNFLTEDGPGDICSYEIKVSNVDPKAPRVSLKKVYAAFNGLVEKMGYKFKPDEQYPYYLPTLAQRTAMLFENKLPREYMLEKQAYISNKLTAENAATLAKDCNDADGLLRFKKNIYNCLIDHRIAQLEYEKKRWFNFTKTKAIKIILLKNLKRKLKTDSLEEALKNMESEKNIHHLWDGRTGLMMLQIQKVDVSPSNSISLIDHEIIRLNHQSHKLFSMASQKDMQKSIGGLKKLKAILSAGGYRIEEALAYLSAKNPEEYRAIVKHQKVLLKKLKEIDQYLVDVQIGKKTIDNFPLEIPEKHEDMAYIQTKIAAQVELLKNEMKDYLKVSSVKRNKIALLLELNLQLRDHSLPQALEIIAKNKKFSHIYKQLFLGRTGKLLKKLETLVMTPADIQARLAAEISYLKLDHRQAPVFFKSEEMLHQRHQEILEGLAKTLADNPTSPITEFLTGIPIQLRDMIQREDGHLLTDIVDWQNAQIEKAVNISRPPL